ncbi:YXWGXW repeat-containing protein [Foetidibacter luteolus]|uniref:YXWGXW repeat-containing protein n=1 Tax=Foetidibacter luteolus TaxID=2608880 RepID=UPI00129BAD01|nr:YXWGXW repeat-containing protein [Foetidibacter luteolus]
MNTGKLFLAAAFLLGITLSSCATQSRVVVRERPVARVVVAPPPPYPGAVWVGEEYIWRGGRYRYVAPHYVRPRRAQVWVPGRWSPARGGYVWIGGRWR